MSSLTPYSTGPSFPPLQNPSESNLIDHAGHQPEDREQAVADIFKKQNVGGDKAAKESHNIGSLYPGGWSGWFRDYRSFSIALALKMWEAISQYLQHKKQ